MAAISASVAAVEPHFVIATMPSTTQTPVVPRKASMNAGVGAWRLIDCMAAMPAGAGARRRPLITNVEKAKNTPATRPLPTAPMMVSVRTNAESITPRPRRRLTTSVRSRGARPRARWTPSASDALRPSRIVVSSATSSVASSVGRPAAISPSTISAGGTCTYAAGFPGLRISRASANVSRRGPVTS